MTNNSVTHRWENPLENKFSINQCEYLIETYFFKFSSPNYFVLKCIL